MLKSWVGGMRAGGFSVFAGVGERTREGNDLYKEMVESVNFLTLLSWTCISMHLTCPARGILPSRHYYIFQVLALYP
jgi:hypothetical protein